MQEGHTKECAARQRQLRTMILRCAPLIADAMGSLCTEAVDDSFKGKDKGKGKGKGKGKSKGKGTADHSWCSVALTDMQNHRTGFD